MRDLFPAGATLPVWPVDDDGHCTCWLKKECRRPGKHADEKAPETSGAWALATGDRSGIVVIDVDRKPGCPDGFLQFEAMLPGEDWPDTLTVTTPNNGAQLYFLKPKDVGHIGNGKLASAIDVRCDEANEGGLAYVIGPGSLGYCKTDDPCRVVPGLEYEGDGRPIAPLPEWLLGRLLMRGTDKKKGFAPTPVDIDTDEGQKRLELGIEACKTMPACHADGEAGMRLFNLCLVLMRRLELPLEIAGALIVEHFNPRCTQADGVTPYPWSDDEIGHKLEDARDKSDLPCGLPPEGIREIIQNKAKPPLIRELEARMAEGTPVTRRKTKNPAHEYTCHVGDAVEIGDAISLGAAIQTLAKHPSWEGVLQYDSFRDRVIAVDPPIQLDAEEGTFTDSDVVAIRHWFECQGFLVSKDACWDAAMLVAKKNAFHPVREYLSDLGDCPGAIERLATEAMGIPAEDELSRLYLRKFLMGAVRRVLEPGCQVDNVLVLFGEGGMRKTSFVRTLFGRDWITENLAALDDTKANEEILLGKWCGEIAELKDLLRAGDETAKSFITRCQGTYRPAYGRTAIDRKRQTVFIGTTNEDAFLRDATGNRRYWIVRIDQPIDTSWIESHRDAVWGEAFALVRAGEQHWLTPEQEKASATHTKEYEEVDPWHDDIVEYCKGKPMVRVPDIFTSLGGSKDRLTRKEQMRISDTLKRLGCTRHLVGRGNVRMYEVPAHIRDEKPMKPVVSALKGAN